MPGRRRRLVRGDGRGPGCGQTGDPAGDGRRWLLTDLVFFGAGGTNVNREGCVPGRRHPASRRPCTNEYIVKDVLELPRVINEAF